MWVLDYLDDIESDMSVFHRVDDPWSMPAPRFFAFASRLPAYNGAVAIAYAAAHQATPIEASSPVARPAGNVVDIRQAAALAPDWIEVVKAG